MRLPCRGLLVLVIAAMPTAAQVVNEFDFDTTQLPVTTIPAGSGTWTITSPVTYSAQSLQLTGNIVVAAGGELLLERSHLVVRGDITLRRGGRITVLDSSLLIASDFTGQFNLTMEGGLLHTERAVLGGAYANGTIHLVRFLHLRGTWLARQTTVQASGALLANGAQGWYGNPDHRGGSIFADGLYEGDYADAIHMSGVGDVVLANGTMNVGLYYEANSAGQPSAATIDLQNVVPIDVCYGDPLIHEGVTNPVPGALCRLQLSRHRSAGWQFFARNVTQSGPLCTLTLRNVRDAIFGVTCDNVSGTPILGGPWSNYYTDLPGLPSTYRPGHHPIPPGCSVQIGNVVFRSDVNEWSRILSWGLYFHGANNNFTVTGPSLIAEVMVWGGQVHLRGSRSYDMGVQANVAHVLNSATLTIDNAAVGTHDSLSSYVGLVEASNSASCSIANSRVAPIRLRATAPGTAITAQNLIGVNNVTVESGSGSIQVSQATAGQNWDLQNVSMDVPGPGVPFWSVNGLVGTLVTDGAPGAPGNLSREIVASAGGGTMSKSLTLSPDTHVTVIVSTKLLQSAGPSPEIRVRHGGTTMSASLGPATGSWRRTHVPLLTTASGSVPTIIELVCSGGATLRIDDVRVCIHSWWDNASLANLNFDGQCRHTGPAPTFLRSPDGWLAGLADCEPDPGVLRPGAGVGTRSVRATMPPSYGHFYKDLGSLRAGDQVVISGWMRGVAVGTNTTVAAQIGDGPTWAYATGNNQEVLHPCDGVWRQFNMTYTVPPNHTTTRLGLSGWTPAGAQCWFDDLTVTIQ
jgi:hypothetical protein